jgi:hypothetical protein
VTGAVKGVLREGDSHITDTNLKGNGKPSGKFVFINAVIQNHNCTW